MQIHSHTATPVQASIGSSFPQIPARKSQRNKYSRNNSQLFHDAVHPPVIIGKVNIYQS